MAKQRPIEVNFYQSDKNNKWYWRAIARNGRIIADGSQGYSSERNVQRAVYRFIGDISDGNFSITREK